MKIVLRPVTISDGNLIVKWRNSPLVRQHCMTRPKVTIESNRNFYHSNIVTGKYKQFIVERYDSEFSMIRYPIATVYLKDIDLFNRRCELCIFTSEDEEWNTESQSIAIKILIKKAFTEYGLHKIYSYVFCKFPREIELLENAGLKKEAILEKEAMNDDGVFEDIVRMSIIKEE